MVNLPFRGKVLLQVYDATGKIVLSKRAENNSPVQIDVGSLNKGIYILRVTDEKGDNKSEKWGGG